MADDVSLSRGRDLLNQELGSFLQGDDLYRRKSILGLVTVCGKDSRASPTLPRQLRAGFEYSERVTFASDVRHTWCMNVRTAKAHGE